MYVTLVVSVCYTIHVEYMCIRYVHTCVYSVYSVYILCMYSVYTKEPAAGPLLFISCVCRTMQRGHCAYYAHCNSVYTIHKEIIVMNILKVLFVIIGLSGLLVGASLGVAECLVDLF